METRQEKIDRLIEEAGLGFRDQGPACSVVGLVKGDSVQLYDDQEDITLTYISTVEILKKVAQESFGDCFHFWNLVSVKEIINSANEFQSGAIR